MTQPLPITNELVEELNRLYRDGLVLKADFNTEKLKRRVEGLSKIDPPMSRVLLSAYFGLIGKWDAMRSNGQAAVRMYMNDPVRIAYATTLCNTGFFAQASEMQDSVGWFDPLLNERKWELGASCALYGRIIGYKAVCQKANLPVPEHINMPIIQAAHDILTANNISEKTVCEMLDIAGEMLRERGFLRKYELSVSPFPEDGTITIMQPVNATSDIVAEMDWEYAERLFTKIPDAPATVVHVGFSMAGDE